MEDITQPVKQVIVIRRDLKVRRGKEIAQGAHAAMAWLTRRISLNLADCDTAWHMPDFSRAEYEWMTGSFRKIVCQVPDEGALRAVFEVARSAGLTAELITDIGATEFHGEPTVTALAVGPDWESLVDEVTGDLELY